MNQKDVKPLIDDGKIRLECNTDQVDWVSGVKYEGWKIIDGARPNQEVTEKSKEDVNK